MTSPHPFAPFMKQALQLAEDSRCHTYPNPAVGAVLVRDGRVVAQGRHCGAGTDHAEVACLADARHKGILPEQCTMVVTLEPCSHYGRNPPCTQAVLEAGIKHVVIGAMEPTAQASGGAAILQANGVHVETGVCEEACLDLIDDFIVWKQSDFPYTFLKLAATLDGRIAARTGHSQWITGEASRKAVHALRRKVQAVIVGGNTFYLDNPQLTCRSEENPLPDDQQPLAVVATSRLPDAVSPYYLLQHRPRHTVFWTTIAAAASPKAEALRKIGVRVVGLSSHPRPSARGYGMRAELNLEEGLVHLRKELGCYYALCEGGGRLGLSMLEKGFVRELHLHLAPKILGDNEATPLFNGRAPTLMDEALQLRLTDAQPCAGDILLTLRPRDRSLPNPVVNETEDT